MTAPSTEQNQTRPAPRLRTRYRQEIAGELREQFGHSNPHQVRGLTKVVLNMGLGDAARDSKLIDGAVRDLSAITGQKPEVRRARKSVSQFKLRQGMPIGVQIGRASCREGVWGA